MNLFKLNTPLFAPEGTEGGSTEPDETDDGTGGESTDDAGKKKEPVTFSEEQQALIDKLIGDTRKSEREKAKKEADAKAQKDKEEADRKALEEQGEFKKVAEKADQRALEAEKRAEEAEARMKSMELQRDFNSMVSELGYKFKNAKAEEIAFSKLDLETVGEDGKGMKEAVNKLITDFDFVFDEDAGEVDADIDARSKGSKKRGEINQARKKDLGQRFRLPKPR